MGLDLVGLVMEVEDEFGISIPDRDAERIQTVGDLYAYVRDRVAAAPVGSCRSREVFYALRRPFVSVCRADRSAVRPSGRVDDHLPTADRRAAWATLAANAGLKLPHLRPPTPVVLAVLIVGSAAVAAATLGSLTVIASNPWMSKEGRKAAIVVGTSVAVLVAATVVLRRAATRLPAGCETFRGLTRRVVALNSNGPADRRRPDGAVWDRLVQIVCEQLDVPPERVKPPASFINDLDAG